MTPPPEAPSTGKQAGVLIGLILLCQGAGALGALTTETGAGSWYMALNKPPFNPPGWVFGPVWITLYTLMGIAAWRVWRAGARGQAPSSAVRGALIAFGIQLALNAAWTPIFFGAGLLLVALGVIIAMVVAIGWTIKRFGPIDRPAAWMLAPYLAWVSFATVLNASLWWLNR